jgi:hypothetical protein
MTDSRAQQPQLDRLRRELDEADARAAALAASCSADEWRTRPPGGGWSPSECLQHLVLSVDAMLPRIEEALKEGLAQDLRSHGPFGPGLLGRLLLWSIEPPYRMRTRTAPSFIPPSARLAPEDLAELSRAHDGVRATIERARGIALNRLTMESPFDARVRYNIWTALAILPAHARRHLWQAEQTLVRIRRA